ncbi:MAG: anhydro-N-acetylmuramic acid kinase [Bdellovibrionales bacterium]
MDEQKVYKAIGLMSGTSLDSAIDVALIETDGETFVKPLDFYTHACDANLDEAVRACFGKRNRDDETRAAEALVTQAHIDAVKAAGFDAGVIGFHGQTITHDPDGGITWQLGCAQTLAEETGIGVVADMRQADVKAGGQGAPLAPLYHGAIAEAHDHDGDVAILNVGGVANVTYVGQELIAFDTGPGNALMDDYCQKHFGQDYDKGGQIAHSGKADRAVVDAFLERGYFQTLIPKSLDRNDFADFIDELPEDPKDAMATLAVCSAAAVMAAVKFFPRAPNAWYVSGGGRHNDFLMELLRDMLMPGTVEKIDSLGFDGDAIEAQAFAYLAVRSLRGLPLTVPGTTGVPMPTNGGVYYPA